MHMYDMVKIDTIAFEIFGGRGTFNPPPPGSLTISNTPDRIGLNINIPSRCMGNNRTNAKLFQIKSYMYVD